MENYIEYTTKFGNTGRRRTNPDTGELFRKGDTLPDGSVFLSYDSNKNNENIFIEKWKRPPGFKAKTGPKPSDKPKKVYKYERTIFERTHWSKRGLARKSGYESDLTAEYLRSIYPEDLMCPVFGVEMEEGGDNYDLRPQLDRINPNKGYMVGNVAWISGRANRLKNNGSIEEFQKIVLYLGKKVS